VVARVAQSIIASSALNISVPVSGVDRKRFGSSPNTPLGARPTLVTTADLLLGYGRYGLVVRDAATNLRDPHEPAFG
jgi:hypothetical protein